VLSLPPTSSDAEQRVRWLAGLVGIVFGALVLATWSLWYGRNPLWPRVPCVLYEWPEAYLPGFAGGLLVGCACLLWRRRLGGRILAVCLLILFQGDQLRLQPWAWHFWFLAVSFGLGKATTVIESARWLTVSIYLFSAISKVDAAFPDEAGTMFLAPLFDAAPTWQTTPSGWSWRDVAVWTLPLGEAITAMCLTRPRTWRIGVVLATMMHVALLARLGPWGLDHSIGVLGWNLYFLVQNPLIFSPAVANKPLPLRELFRDPGEDPADDLARTVVALAVSLPCLSLCLPIDPWMAWGVYAPPLSKPTVWVSGLELDQLPADLQSAARPVAIGQSPPGVDDATLWIDLTAWTLATHNVPDNPSPRYRFALARGLKRRLEESGSAKVSLVFYDRSSRWSRTRSPGQPLRSAFELPEFQRNYVMNSRPAEP
jgi:hypothetical protein